MRSASMLLMLLLLALAATAAFAQTCPSPCPAAVQCPAPLEPACGVQCPAPAPCPETCTQTQLCPQQEQCPCPVVNPAAIGAGPAVDLANLSCADFDKAYANRIYNQNNTVVALTTEGIQRANNKNLRDISGEIRTNVTSENVKLSDWYSGMGMGTVPVDFNRTQTILDSLSTSTGNCFDVAYAQTLIGVLVQSRDSNMLAMNKSALPEIRNQARVALRHENDEIFRLQRWLNDHGVCPPEVGAGPCVTETVITQPACPTPCPTPCPTVAPAPCPAPCPAPAPACPAPCPTAAPPCSVCP